MPDIPLPTRELRRRLDRLTRIYSYLMADLPRTVFRPPTDPREILDSLVGMERHLFELRDLTGDLLVHVKLLMDLAGEDLARDREAERVRYAEAMREETDQSHARG